MAFTLKLGGSKPAQQAATSPQPMPTLDKPTQPQLKPAQLKPQKQAVDSNVTFLTTQMNTENRRLRIIEERYITLRRNIQVIDQNLLTNYKKISTDVKTVASNLGDLKKKISEINDKLDIIQKELSVCVKKEDIAVLDRYVNLWNPSMFVTRSEAETLIAKKLPKQTEATVEEPEENKQAKFIDS